MTDQEAWEKAVGLFGPNNAVIAHEIQTRYEREGIVQLERCSVGRRKTDAWAFAMLGEGSTWEEAFKEAELNVKRGGG